MQSSILLIAPEAASQAIADALRHELNLSPSRASTRRSGLAALRRNQYSLVLIDEQLVESDGLATELIFQNAGSAPVLEIDFPLTSTDRVVRQARIALQRRADDERKAREAASASLQAELRSALSGLLLESQLALREARPEQPPKLRQLVQMAGDLRDRLRA